MPHDCRHCGATIENQSARFCEFCGTEVVREDAPRMPTRDESRKTRFELLQEHPELSRWMGYTPEDTPVLSLGSAAVLFPAVVVVCFGFYAVFGFAGGPGSGGMRFVPIAFFAAIGAILLSKGANHAKRKTAPLVRRPAIVVDERTKVSGGNNSGARTRYFVTIETADGRRNEYLVTERIAGDVTRGDAGVAYLKHDRMVDFRRLSV